MTNEHTPATPMNDPVPSAPAAPEQAPEPTPAPVDEQPVAAAKPWSYIAIDTETSGMFDFKKPADDPDQPRLAEAAIIFVTPEFAIEREFHALIKPDGWDLSADAAEINGLSMDMLNAHGIPVGEVLDVYEAAIEEGRAVIAHNAQFDCKMMRAEFRRADRDDLFERTHNVCTMRSLVGVCKLRQKNNRGYRWPKLEEACSHFYLPQDDAHTALGDTRAVVRLAKKMAEIGVLPEPKVHYAKNPPKKQES